MGPTSTKSSSVKGLAAVLIGLLVLSATVQGLGAEGKTIGDRKCFLCHQDHKKSYPQTIHGSLGGEKDSTSCESCHGPGREHMLGEGDLTKIVVFEKLTTADSSRRCLTCHEKGAKKGGHLDGFLDSSYLAKGMGCTSCHQAHAPAAAATAAPKPAKRIGTKACLVCHSDFREYSHREQAEELMGCETCHGPGRAHAVARGDATLIRNPERKKAPASDKACVLCHSDMTAPDHPKEPVEGKTRCVDCHAIHTHAEEAAAPPEALPGKPSFKLEVAEVAPPPEEKPGPFMTPSMPSTPEDGPDILGLRTTGEMRFGYRLTDVDDNERVYDQDYGYDEGFRIFEFDLSGESITDPGLKFRAEGAGVDDPVQHYSLDLQQKDEWAFAADWTRTDLVYYASGDPRDQSARRDRVGSEFSYLLSKDMKITAGADLWWREGDMYGARLVSGAVTASKEPFDEDGGFAWLRLDWADGPFKLALQQGYRWENIDSDIDAGALDYDQDTDVTAPVTTVLAEYVAQEGLLFDTKFVWSPVDTDTDTTSKTRGTSGQVRGDIDGDREFFRGEIGATWVAREDFTVRFRLEHFVSDEDTDGDFRDTTPGGSNSADDYDRDQKRWRARGEVQYQFVDWGLALAGYEWMTDDYDVKENGDKDSSDSETTGPVFGVELDPVKGLHIDALYRFVSVDDPYTEIGTEDKDQARLRVRYRPSATISVSAFATHSKMTNQRHDTKVRAWSTGLATVFIPFEELIVEAGYDYQVFKTDTEVVRFRGGVPFSGESDYDARTDGGYLNLVWEVTPEFRLKAGGSLRDTEGDFASNSHELFFGSEYRFQEEMSVGSDIRLVKYNEEGSDSDDYKAWIVEMWLKVGF